MFWWTFLLQIFCQLCLSMKDFIKIVRLVLATVSVNGFNHSNAEATIVRSTRTGRFLKTIQTLSCWYSLDSSRWVLSVSNEYPCARVTNIFQGFSHRFILAKLATSSIRVNIYSCVEISLTSVVWTCHTFKHNLEVGHKFAKYLKERCRQSSEEYFSIK